MKNNLFTEVKVLDTSYNTFDLTHDKKMSFNMGQLIPNCVIETIPGDNFNINSNNLIRLAPMLAPMMHKVDVFQHFFYVPTRILWPSAPEFFSENENNPPVFPTIDVNEIAQQQSQILNPGDTLDYFGIPTRQYSEALPISAVPFAGYAKIWDEFYRDQNLQPKIDFNLTDGDNTSLFLANNLNTPLIRAWEKDYFTSSLPFVQKGSPVTIPLGTSADITYDNTGTTYLKSNLGQTLVFPGIADAKVQGFGGDIGQLEQKGAGTSPNIGLRIDNSEQLSVDLSSATSATINDLRLAFKMQQYLELSARTGTRYTEYLRGHWNVMSSDRSLQRPVYLGGSKSPLIVSEVLQTSETNTAVTPQGNMSGHGYAVSNANSFNYKCEEHGYIIGLVSILPKPVYMNGIHKHFLRKNKFDFYHPVFANLGEQAVQNIELFVSDDPVADYGTFGYQARWAEYRDLPSTIHGQFRTDLEFWHMARDFSSLPQLNANFIECDPTTRIFAVQSLPGEPLVHNVWATFLHQVKVGRKMPMFGIPQII